ncbi:MAG: acyl-CoA reductase [Elusimicrobiota bacterium]|jgi:hypothetical protein
MLKPSCVDRLGQVAASWLDPTLPGRLQAIEALEVSTGMARPVIERAIRNAFEALSHEKLSEFVRKNKIEPDNLSERAVLHICAGNVFTSWLPGVVISILMGFRCWIKPSTQEPVFARQWVESVRKSDHSLAERISVVSWKEDLVRQAGAIVAYGSDETLENIRQKTNPSTTFIGYGSKMSIAVLFKEALLGAQSSIWGEKTILDCELFDLNGCLSPQILFLEENIDKKWLDSVFAKVQKQPKIKAFSDLKQLLSDLEQFKGFLSSIGVAGSLERLAPIRNQLEMLGVTRFCPLGEMQRPPLSWRNGGISLVDVLRLMS